MGEWKKAKIGDFISVKHGYAFPGEGIIAEDNGIVLVTPGNFRVGGGYKDSGKKFFKGEYPADYVLKAGDFIVTMTDLSKESDTLGYSAIVPASSDYIYLHNQRIGLVEFHSKGIDRNFLYWLMRTKTYQHEIVAGASGTTVKHTSPSRIADVEISVPPLSTQKKIAAVLGALDDKIENNRKICKTLEEQAQAIFKSWFVDNDNRIDDIVPMQEVFDVTIGRTPPRKEFEWFSESRDGNSVWVSIADMGGCGTFIADSSEYLTPQAIEKFNLRMVPQGTVLLSFKLTVGRVAIADVDLVTNEAIAQMRTSSDEAREYLYCYLKQFDYDTLGSTSSIATAVNSTTIREMPYRKPKAKELCLFHETTKPLFEMIRARSKEIAALAELRDALLPKLMSGEIDVEKVVV